MCESDCVSSKHIRYGHRILLVMLEWFLPPYPGNCLVITEDMQTVLLSLNVESMTVQSPWW